MKARSASEKAFEYIESYERQQNLNQKKLVGPCITVSRESGAGSGLVDEILKEYLQKYQKEGYGQWAIFDKNLIEKVIEDYNLPTKLTNILAREGYTTVDSMIRELFGLQPSMVSLLHKTAKTILQLANIGNVIIVGRGAPIITANLKNTFHFRLVAPHEDRIKRIMEYYNLNRKEAIDWIHDEDNSRKEYFMKNYHRNIEDPLLYHMTINTHLMSYEEAAYTIGNAVIKKFPHMFNVKSITAAEVEK
jgi:cytidylate kinase